MGLKLPLLLRLPSSGSKPQLVLEVLSKSLLPVPPMSEDTSTVLSLRLLPDLECLTLLLTPLTLLPPSQPLPPLPQLLSTLDLLLLPLNTSSKDLRPRLAPSPSLLSSPVLPKVPPTLGCVRLPLSPQSTQLSTLV